MTGSEAGGPYRVMVVDDHPVVRQGLIAVLETDSRLVVVAEASSGEEALADVAETRPDVVVLDVRLPGMNGIETALSLRDAHPDIAILLITGFPDDDVMRTALAMGAWGVLVKESHPAVVLSAVLTVAGGGIFIDPRLAALFDWTDAVARTGVGPHGLTTAEMRVLKLLPSGLSNKEIGEELGVSEATVKTHVFHAMRKLRVHNRAEASALVVRERLD